MQSSAGLLAVHHTVIAVEQFTNLNILENRMNPYRFSRYTLELQIDNLVVFEAKKWYVTIRYSLLPICYHRQNIGFWVRSQSLCLRSITARMHSASGWTNLLMGVCLPFSAFSEPTRCILGWGFARILNCYRPCKARQKATFFRSLRGDLTVLELHLVPERSLSRPSIAKAANLFLLGIQDRCGRCRLYRPACGFPRFSWWFLCPEP